MLTNNQNKNQKKPLVTNFIRNLLPFGVRSQQGSTLPMAIGLGSAMMIVGAVAVMKGGQESTNTTSSEQTKQALAIAEGGVENTLYKFTQGEKGANKFLLLANYDKNDGGWKAPEDEDVLKKLSNGKTDKSGNLVIEQANGCSEENGTAVLDTSKDPKDFYEPIISEAGTIFDAGKIGKDTFELLSSKYDKNNESTEFEIVGKKANNLAQAKYKVTVPVTITPPSGTASGTATAAGLMAKDMNTKGMAIFTNTSICTDPENGTNCGNNIAISDPSYCSDGVLGVDTSKDYSSLSSNEKGEYSQLEKMMGVDKNGFRAPDNKKPSNIVITSTEIPATPIAPSGATILYVDMKTGNIAGKTESIRADKSGSKIKNAYIDLHKQPFASAFVEEMVDGELYHAIYIQAQNVDSVQDDINVVINKSELEKITVNSKNIDAEKMIVRLYIAEDTSLGGNSAVNVYDGSDKRITGTTEDERKQIASLRIIGGNADGTSVGDLTWTMKGTVCIMGHIHAPTATISLPQGNGCGNSGGQTPISLNGVAANEYGSGNYLSIGSSVGTPNVFGAIWVKNFTNSSSGASGSFYENPSLTQNLMAEFGNAYPSISGSIENAQINLELTRKVVREAVN